MPSISEAVLYYKHSIEVINTNCFYYYYSINNKLHQPEAAAGVLEYAMKNHGDDLVSIISLFRFTDWNYWHTLMLIQFHKV